MLSIWGESRAVIPQISISQYHWLNVFNRQTDLSMLMRYLATLPLRHLQFNILSSSLMSQVSSLVVKWSSHLKRWDPLRFYFLALILFTYHYPATKELKLSRIIRTWADLLQQFVNFLLYPTLRHTGFWLVNREQVTLTLASHWLTMSTWSGHSKVTYFFSCTETIPKIRRE